MHRPGSARQDHGEPVSAGSAADAPRARGATILRRPGEAARRLGGGDQGAGASLPPEDPRAAPGAAAGANPVSRPASECGQPANLLLDWYLNDSLGSAERATVEAHLKECTACARELRELTEITRAMSLGAHRPEPRYHPLRRVAFATAAVLVPLALLAGWL